MQYTPGKSVVRTTLILYMVTVFLPYAIQQTGIAIMEEIKKVFLPDCHLGLALQVSQYKKLAVVS